MTVVKKAKPSVRPRSQRAHDAAIDAAIRLFAERGIEGTSMDAISEESGVSKATLYKHWADKDALCMEVMIRVNGMDQPRPDFNSGDLKQDLKDLLKYKPPEHPSLLRDRLMPHLIAYGAKNQRFGIAWRSRVIEPPRVQLVELLERGIRKGILPKKLDIQLASALLIGPMMYNHIFCGSVTPLQDLAEGVVESFWRAHAKPE